MKSLSELIGELEDLQSLGVEHLEFIDSEGNNYDLQSLDQSGAKEFGYMIFKKEDSF